MLNIKEGSEKRTNLLKRYWRNGKEYHKKSSEFISNYEDQIVVIKYGGFSLKKKKLVTYFAKNISLLNQLGIKIIVVHGGGPQIETELRKQKIIDKEYQCLRITTKEILKIVKKILGKELMFKWFLSKWYKHSPTCNCGWTMKPTQARREECSWICVWGKCGCINSI